MKIFHVSKKYLGKIVVLEPKIPGNMTVEEMTNKYAKIPRICCSETIVGCLKGITKIKLAEIMYVYQPIGKCDVNWDDPRRCCSDWVETEECWIQFPTKFKFLYAIKPDRDITFEAYTYDVVDCVQSELVINGR